MTRSITLNLPDALVRHAKSYAAPPRLDDPLAAFSNGRMAKEAVIEALGLRNYAQVLLALGQRGLPLPKLPGHEVEAMADNFVRIYQLARKG